MTSPIYTPNDLLYTPSSIFTIAQNSHLNPFTTADDSQFPSSYPVYVTMTTLNEMTSIFNQNKNSSNQTTRSGFQWSTNDLFNIFSQFGLVVDVVVQEFLGIVYFADLNDANLSILHLNGKEIKMSNNDIDGEKTLYYLDVTNMPSDRLNNSVTIHRGLSADSTTSPTLPSKEDNNNPLLGRSRVSTAASEVISTESPMIVEPLSNSNSNSIRDNRKFTCRFEIGIVNDKCFQVSRRIIGTRGENTRRIYENTGAKLRLRGQGSGYHEGYSHKESPEPLHLCISATSSESYIEAVDEVVALLDAIYADYEEYRLKSISNGGCPSIELSDNSSGSNRRGGSSGGGFKTDYDNVDKLKNLLTEEMKRLCLWTEKPENAYQNLLCIM